MGTEIQIGFIRIDVCRSKCPGDLASVLSIMGNNKDRGTCFLSLFFAAKT